MRSGVYFQWGGQGRYREEAPLELRPRVSIQAGILRLWWAEPCWGLGILGWVTGRLGGQGSRL